MTQFEVKRGSPRSMAHVAGWGSPRCAPSYAPGGIMAMEASTMALGLMLPEIRRTRPGSTRDAYAKGYAQRSW